MLYSHLESQYDISPQMDVLQKKGFLLQKLSATLHSLFDSETHQLPYKDSYRCTGPMDAIAAAKGLEIGRRFPESENKLGLSIPAQALTCPLEEALPEPLPKTFTGRLRPPDDEGVS